MVNIYANFGNTANIFGDSGAPGYERWFTCLSYTWSGNGAGGGRAVSGFYITLSARKSAANLMLACMKATVFPSIFIAEVDPSGNQVRKYTFLNSRIVSFAEFGSDADDRAPSMELEIQFAEITLETDAPPPTGGNFTRYAYYDFSDFTH